MATAKRAQGAGGEAGYAAYLDARLDGMLQALIAVERAYMMLGSYFPVSHAAFGSAGAGALNKNIDPGWLVAFEEGQAHVAALSRGLRDAIGAAQGRRQSLETALRIVVDAIGMHRAREVTRQFLNDPVVERRSPWVRRQLAETPAWPFPKPEGAA